MDEETGHRRRRNAVLTASAVVTQHGSAMSGSYAIDRIMEIARFIYYGDLDMNAAFITDQEG